MNQRAVIRVVSLLTVALLGAGCGGSDGDRRLVIAFLYDGPIAEIGWSHQLDQGRRVVEESFPQVEARVLEEVRAMQLVATIDALVAEGVDMFFGPGCCYGELLASALARHQEIVLENVKDRPQGPNMASFDGRIYEASYLTGIAAGRMTRTGLLGYVAAWRHPDVVLALDAFALGARSVHPEVQIRVEWVNAWYHPEREAAAAGRLLDAGADVLAGYTDSPAVIEVARQRGQQAIGFHSDMLAVAPDTVVTSALWTWDAYYRTRVAAVLDGTWRAQEFWGGLREETVTVGQFGAAVPPEVVAEVAAARDRIARGELRIFRGELRDHLGAPWLAAEEELGDAELRQLDDVFVPGVVVDAAAGLPPG